MKTPNPKFDIKEWRAQKAGRREKQRQTNLTRVKSMHKFRLEHQTNSVPIRKVKLTEKFYIGCSGWF